MRKVRQSVSHTYHREVTTEIHREGSLDAALRASLLQTATQHRNSVRSKAGGRGAGGSARPGGERGGALMGKPRWARILPSRGGEDEGGRWMRASTARPNAESRTARPSSRSGPFAIGRGSGANTPLPFHAIQGPRARPPGPAA